MPPMSRYRGGPQCSCRRSCRRRSGGRPRGTAGGGEEAHPRARCAGRQAPPDAADGRGEGLPLRGPRRPGEPARPLRGAPPADRVPLLLRAGRRRLARAWLRRLLVSRRPGRSPRASQRPRHHAGVRVARAAARHRALEGADGLGDAVVHAHRRFRRRLRRRRVARHERLRPRRRRGLPHVLRQQPRRRGDGHHLELPRHHRARAPGGVGGLAGGLPADAAVPVVEPPRRVRRYGLRRTHSASTVGLDGTDHPAASRSTPTPTASRTTRRLVSLRSSSGGV